MADNNPLETTFAGQPLARHAAGWDALWRQQTTPWDRGGPSVALDEIVARRKDVLGPAVFRGSDGAQQRKSALVPGCGRGHDVLLLAAWGYNVVGLDVSAEASARAAANEREHFGEDTYRARDGGGKGKVTWVTGNFWGDEWFEQAGRRQFDLIFDYTVRPTSLF
jgi:methyl halide transferase